LFGALEVVHEPDYSSAEEGGCREGCFGCAGHFRWYDRLAGGWDGWSIGGFFFWGGGGGLGAVNWGPQEGELITLDSIGSSQCQC